MSNVWHVPADDGSGEVEIRPVTIVRPIIGPDGNVDAYIDPNEAEGLCAWLAGDDDA